MAHMGILIVFVTVLDPHLISIGAIAINVRIYSPGCSNQQQLVNVGSIVLAV